MKKNTPKPLSKGLGGALRTVIRQPVSLQQKCPSGMTVRVLRLVDRSERNTSLLSRLLNVVVRHYGYHAAYLG